MFANKIKLLPEELGVPLATAFRPVTSSTQCQTYSTRTSRRRLHLRCVRVMEKAWWHVFQVLTKRPQRMADFTRKRYAGEAPPNIWLGTSTENQETFDERSPHLLNVKAAVRWLSCEPLLGPLAKGTWL